MATADLILFGIQSAIMLGVSARQAYVDATAGRAFALPLPEFDAKPNASVAVRYFLDRPAIDRSALVKALLQKVADRERDPSKPELTDDDEHELINSYLEALLLEGGGRQGKIGTVRAAREKHPGSAERKRQVTPQIALDAGKKFVSALEGLRAGTTSIDQDGYRALLKLRDQLNELVEELSPTNSLLKQ